MSADEGTSLLGHQKNVHPDDSASEATSADFIDESERPWPATFERSISLLASPVIAERDVKKYTKSPKPGSTPLTSRNYRYSETPQGSLYPPLVRHNTIDEKLKNTNLANMDFKTATAALRKEHANMTALDEARKIKEKKSKEAAEYRAKILKQQGSDPEASPGYRKESALNKRSKKEKAEKKAASRGEGKATFSQCVFNLANILMGVGLLGLPYAFAKAGWAGGTVALLTFSLVAWRTAILIGRELNGDPRPAEFFDDSPYKTPVQPNTDPSARMRRPLKSFPAIAGEAFGGIGTVSLSIVLYFELFSCMCIFIVTMSQHMHALVPSISEMMFMILCSIATAVPIVLLNSARLLSYLSMVGTFATISVVGAVVLAAIVEGDMSEGIAAEKEPQEDIILHPTWIPSGLPLAFGLVAYCFSGHAIVPAIYSSMEEPREFERVVNVTFLIVMLSCFAVGLSGYYMFGAEVFDQVTLSLEANSTAVLAMKLLTMLMVLTAFSKTTLTMFPLALGMEEIVAPYLSSDFAMRFASSIIKMVLLALALLVAMFVPSFSFLCELVGMICTMTVSVIFPAAAHLALFGGKLGFFEKALDWIFVIVGSVMAVAGTINAV